MYASVAQMRLSNMYDEPNLKVDRNDCMLWAGPKNHGGYGRIRLDGKYVPVYRVVYESLYGPIEKPLVPDHLCNVPACFNPDHIEPVTTAENTKRHYERFYKGKCKNGHPNENTSYVWAKNLGQYMKNCRTCHNEANARYRKKLKTLNSQSPDREEDKR